MRPALSTLALLALAACSKPPPQPDPANTAAKIVSAPEKPAADAYLGRWTGVEGMYLVVSRDEAPGQYRLEMKWDLDHSGTVPGTGVGQTIAFTRNGEYLTLHHTDGKATGLKYLDGKKDCLTVKEGEGYCRG
jgi:hypothetical protein